jgi:hypothetical protein
MIAGKPEVATYAKCMPGASTIRSARALYLYRDHVYTIRVPVHPDLIGNGVTSN